MLWTRLILVAVCSLTLLLGPSGCSKAMEKPAEPKKTCAQQVADLQVWLDAMIQDFRWSGELLFSLWNEEDDIFDGTLVQVPWEAGVPPEVGCELKIPKGKRDLVILDGLSLEPKELQGSLAKMVSDQKARFPNTTFSPLLVLVDGKVAWSLVVATSEAARQAGQERVRFIFLPEGGRHAQKPPPSAEFDRVAALYPRKVGGKFIVATGGRPSQVDRAFGEITKGCETLNGFRAAWKGSKPGDADYETNFFIHCAKLLPKALAACNCNLEISALQNLLWRFHPVPVVARSVQLAKQDPTSKECTHIVAPTTAPWESVVPKILAAPRDKPVCFEAKGGN